MLLIVSVYIDHNFTFYREYNRSYVYTATTRSCTAVTHCDVLFYTYFILSQSLYIFTVFRLVSYHIDAEVAQKGTQSLPEDGIVLPKHVGAIVKDK
jgi:hypothetical protein